MGERARKKSARAKKKSASEASGAYVLKKGRLASLFPLPSPPFLLFHSVCCLFNPPRSLVPGYNIRNPQNVNQALKGLCHTIMITSHNVFLHQLNSKNNGPVLLFKTTFRHSNCFMTSVARRNETRNYKPSYFFQVLMIYL